MICVLKKPSSMLCAKQAHVQEPGSGGRKAGCGGGTATQRAGIAVGWAQGSSGRDDGIGQILMVCW